MNMSFKLISEYNPNYRKHTSCYYCLGLTLCYRQRDCIETGPILHLKDHCTFLGVESAQLTRNNNW